MKSLFANVIVDENKRLGDIKFAGHPDVFALYEGVGEQNHFYILTDSSDPKKIYMVITSELWSVLFEQKGVRFNIKNW